MVKKAKAKNTSSKKRYPSYFLLEFLVDTLLSFYCLECSAPRSWKRENWDDKHSARLPYPLRIKKRNWTINPRTKCLSDWIPSATQNNSWETKKCLLTKQTKKMTGKSKKKIAKKRSIPIYCLMNCLSRIKKTYINNNNNEKSWDEVCVKYCA